MGQMAQKNLEDAKQEREQALERKQVEIQRMHEETAKLSQGITATFAQQRLIDEANTQKLIEEGQAKERLVEQLRNNNEVLQ